VGAFILFPILSFILFIATVMGVTDYVHAETLVHAAAQTAVAAAAQDVMAQTNSGDYKILATSSSSTATTISTTTLSCTQSTANVSIPSGATSISVTVSGAGGGGGQTASTYGGNGGLVKATIPISSSQTSLDAIVGCGGQATSGGSGGGGGLSGVFSGTPSQSTALVIAGGGGGGANDDSTTTQSNGTAGGLSPALPYSGGDGLAGGAGYGGGGGVGDGGAGNGGTAFGAGGASSGTYSAAGGYGGGASGGDGWGGGGAGGGYTGGQGGNGGTSSGSGGQGGASYTASSATGITATTGGGGAGGYGSAGTSGSITIKFTSTPVSTGSTTIDQTAASTLISQMLGGNGNPYKRYITGVSCGIAGLDYSCKVNFSTSIPLIGAANGTTTASASITFKPRKYNPPPNYCVNPNTAQPLFSFSTINSTLTDNYICTLPNRAGFLTNGPAEPASTPYANIAISTGQPIPSAFHDGKSTTPSTTATSPNLGTYHPYGYIGLVHNSAFYDLSGVSYRENAYNATGYQSYREYGTGYQVTPICWWAITDNVPNLGSCTYPAPTGGADWTQDVKAIPPSSYYTSIPFILYPSQFDTMHIYYKPACDNYPTSQFASNFNSYIATCVLPYDPSYTPTVAG
jgi:hypothetical protein